jgi:hypothetical protein
MFLIEFFVGPKFVKFFSLSNSKIAYFGGHVPQSSHCSLLIETPLVSQTSWENDLSIAPIAIMDFDNLKNLNSSHITGLVISLNFRNLQIC